MIKNESLDFPASFVTTSNAWLMRELISPTLPASPHAGAQFKKHALLSHFVRDSFATDSAVAVLPVPTVAKKNNKEDSGPAANQQVEAVNDKTSCSIAPHRLYPKANEGLDAPCRIEI